MSFLGGIFKKKPGGTFFGNLLRAGASAATGGMLGAGANRVELGQTQTNAELAKQQTTFAGQPAVKEADGTYAMNQPLNEVSISAKAVKTDTAIPAWMQTIGDKLSYLGGRTTEQTAVGVDNKTLLIIGGGILLLVGVIAMNNNNNYRR